MQSDLKYWAKQFNSIYGDGNWLGETFKSFAEDVNANIVFKKPPGSRNSIAAIVHHLIKWREFFFKKYENDEGYDVNQEASFDVSD